MLAMVEPFARLGVEERAGAAAELSPRLEEFDGDAPFDEGGRGRQARHAAADDRHARAFFLVRRAHGTDSTTALERTENGIRAGRRNSHLAARPHFL